jgi:hypothetical protein
MGGAGGSGRLLHQLYLYRPGRRPGLVGRAQPAAAPVPGQRHPGPPAAAVRDPGAQRPYNDQAIYVAAAGSRAASVRTTWAGGVPARRSSASRPQGLQWLQSTKTASDHRPAESKPLPACLCELRSLLLQPFAFRLGRVVAGAVPLLEAVAASVARLFARLWSGGFCRPRTHPPREAAAAPSDDEPLVDHDDPLEAVEGVRHLLDDGPGLLEGSQAEVVGAPACSPVSSSTRRLWSGSGLCSSQSNPMMEGRPCWRLPSRRCTHPRWRRVPPGW